MEREPASISKRVEDFLQVFKKGEEFTQELLKENEKLRYRVAQLEELTKFSDREGNFKVHSMEERIKFLEEENKICSTAIARSRRRTRTSQTAISR